MPILDGREVYRRHEKKLWRMPFFERLRRYSAVCSWKRRTWNVVCLGGSPGGGNPVGGEDPNELFKWDREISSGRPPRNGISPVDIRPDTGERVYPRY